MLSLPLWTSLVGNFGYDHIHQSKPQWKTFFQYYGKIDISSK